MEAGCFMMAPKKGLKRFHELISAGCKRPSCSAEGVKSMQVDGIRPIGR
jgi:hypothetical protein